MIQPVQNEHILISFYGDDFTGTTATAEALMQSGLPTVIFTEPPAPSYLEEHFPMVRAMGISGIARALPANQLKQTLKPIFKTLKSYQSLIYLYKVCSTFDSSEKVGSIGKAIELGVKLFAPDFVPVFPAAPRLQRFTIFGNHFAAMGDSKIFRLDRHPSMSNHPVTPMKEADLRCHLAKQTDMKSGLINILDIEAGSEKINAQIDALLATGMEVIFFDCLSVNNLNTICETVVSRIHRKKPGFFVGSQEMGYGLVNALIKKGLLSDRIFSEPDHEGVSDKGPILVLSGSCAIVTADQIKWAKTHGFIDLAVPIENLFDTAKKKKEMDKIVLVACNELAAGRSVIVHTAIGPQDERIEAMKKKAGQLSLSELDASRILGAELGDIAQKILRRSSLKRLVIAGGDTSGTIQKYLQIKALQVAKSIGLGAPLCYVFSQKAHINGLEVAFKGGQIGDPDYFIQAQHARTAEFEKVALGTI